jgi:hypothetical protein
MRRTLTCIFDGASQPIRIIIVWKYQSESGQPIAKDHQRMNLLEDALESVLKEDGFSTLALVSTGEGLREWTYTQELKMNSWPDSLTRLPECRNVSIPDMGSHSMRSNWGRLRAIRSRLDD